MPLAIAALACQALPTPIPPRPRSLLRLKYPWRHCRFTMRRQRYAAGVGVALHP